VFRDGKAPQITSLFGSIFLILREKICVTTVDVGFYSKVFVIQPPIILEITYLKRSIPFFMGPEEACFEDLALQQIALKTFGFIQGKDFKL
jgi:hypothetical protein